MQDNREDSVLSNSESKQDAGLTPGSMLGEKYQIVSLIGRGGMGAVYRVHQVLLGKDFALKVLDLHRSSDVTVRRFQQEARTASQLRHRNLVEVHDFGVFDDGQPYLVMDLVDGVTLSQVLKQKGALPVDYAINLCIQVCSGLIYAHEQGVVHRDIKPGNIMLLHPDKNLTEGTVKVVDFGIAKLTQLEEGEIQALTKTGEIFGSPIYMSPEQCQGTAVDRRSDIYSLGCVMFECLTGSPPFLGDSAMTTMLKRLSEAPISLKEGSLGREFPPALEKIVRKMLAVDLDERYQELRAVVKELNALQRQEDAALSQPLQEKAPMNIGGGVNQTLLLVGLAATTIVAVAAYDRFLFFPEKVKEHEAQKVKKDPAAEVAKRVLQQESDAARTRLENAINSGVDKRYPHILTPAKSSGATKQFLFFPDDIGKVIINDETSMRKAVGSVPLPADARITIIIDKLVANDPNILKNITSLKFSTIGYSNCFVVSNETIAILEHIKDLWQVGLKGTAVTSLKPLYKNKTLLGLDVLDTTVPAAEILKLERLGELNSLTMGPLDDATAVFDALAKTKRITNIGLKGSSSDRNAVLKAAIASEFAALSKLKNLKGLSIENCPRFNDAALKKLLPLQELLAVTIRDCPITPKSIATFSKFPRLEILELSTAGWSEADIRALKRLHFKVRVKDASDRKTKQAKEMFVEDGIPKSSIDP